MLLSANCATKPTCSDRSYIISLVSQAQNVPFNGEGLEWVLIENAHVYTLPSSEYTLHNPYRIYSIASIMFQESISRG